MEVATLDMILISEQAFMDGDLMDLRHMRHFVAVAEELHFGRAALRLNMAQPPLSQSIRRLEVALKVELFNRSRRGVELTDAGRAFLEEARRTLMQAELARKVAQRVAAQVPELHVSFVGPALYRVLPELLVRYRTQRPAVNVRLSELSSPEQLQSILAGDHDIGFVTGGTQHISEFDNMIVERAQFVAAVPADWPLAHQNSVSLQVLAEQPFILPPKKYSAQSLSMGLTDLFKNVGVIPRIVQEATQTSTTLSLVGVGLGCSLVMATAELSQPRNVRFLRIEEDIPHARWELAMVWRSARLERLAADFIAITRSYIEANADVLKLKRAHT